MGRSQAFSDRPGSGHYTVQLPAEPDSSQVAPAMAVGAPILQKPCLKTPLSAFALMEIVHEAGWPEDAYRVVFVEGAGAESLVLDPRLPILSFTGSAAVGWRLKSLVPKKRVSLELGGNAGVIVHEDSDLEDAVTRVVAGAFAYSGPSLHFRTASAGARIVV